MAKTANGIEQAAQILAALVTVAFVLDLWTEGRVHRAIAELLRSRVEIPTGRGEEPLPAGALRDLYDSTRGGDQE